VSSKLVFDHSALILLLFHSHWRLDHCGIGFGHCLWCNVVVDDDAIPAATPTAIPSSFQADKNSTETIGSRDLINFDSHELPMSATGKEEMSQMETQLSDESFEAIAAPETGGKTNNQPTAVWLTVCLPVEV
jgi:hypothetical protein